MSANVDLGRLAHNAQTTLRRPSLQRLAFWLTVAVAATLPFEFTKQWFPVSWLEVSRVLMVAAMVATVAAAIRQRAWLAPTRLVGASLLLVLTSAASAAFHPEAVDPKELASSFAYLAFAFTVAWNIRDLRGVAIVATAVVSSALAVALVALLEQVFNFYLWRGDILALNRRNSTLADPNVTARVLAIGLVVLLGLVAAKRSILRRDVAIATGVAAVLGLGEALSQSRTIWVLTVLVLAAWIPLAIQRPRTFVPIGVFVGTMIAAVLVLPFIASRVATINPNDLAAEYGEQLSPAAAMAIGPPTPIDPLLSLLPLDGVRRYLIRAGVAMWVDHPLVGVGLGGFDESIAGPYRDYIPPDRQSAPLTLVHTDVVRVLAETGLVGFAGWLTFVAVFTKNGIDLLRRPGWPRALGMAVLSAFAIILLASQLAGRFASEPYLWLIVGLLIAAPRLEARPAGFSAD